MIVVGGIYQERCLSNNWDYIFGSAGRAAAFLAGPLAQRVSLHGWYEEGQLSSLVASLASYRIKLKVRPSERHYTFDYFHPLSNPRIRPERGPLWEKSQKVVGSQVLLFGALEGFPTIRADKLVIDPQSEDLNSFFEEGRLHAREIAIVANEDEVALRSGRGIRHNIERVFALSASISVVIIKQGPSGATVYDRSQRSPKKISPYKSSRVFKIGSGDVFSAAFIYMWGTGSKSADVSADFASRAVSCYVNDPSMNFTSSNIQAASPIRVRRTQAQVYLAAPFFSMAELMMLGEARRSLQKLGLSVFSPLHDVGIGRDNELIAAADLKGLVTSKAVFAIFGDRDPGTIFEVGFARAKNIPVVAFAENLLEKDKTMFVGTKCIVESDFCTALHKVAWAALG